MKFRTEIDVPQSTHPLDPRRPITLLGSCFSDNIGRKMTDCRWEATVNPCGTLYNPFTIGQTIVNCFLPDNVLIPAIESSLLESRGVTLSWLFDSTVSGRTREECSQKALAAYRRLRSALERSQALICTLGTAYLWRLDAAGHIPVANCHKMDGKLFTRTRMTTADIISQATVIRQVLESRVPQLRVILTVSPIRHLGNGAHQNAVSKALLLQSCEELTELNPERFEYFPAFEIMTDDLRDYRYYADDLVHPSAMAVEYIWEKFQDAYLNAEGRRHLAEGRKITARLSHRNLIPDAPVDEKFQRQTEELLRQFEAKKQEA